MPIGWLWTVAAQPQSPRSRCVVACMRRGMCTGMCADTCACMHACTHARCGETGWRAAAAARCGRPRRLEPASIEPSIEPFIEPSINPSVEPSIEHSIEHSIEPSIKTSQLSTFFRGLFPAAPRLGLGSSRHVNKSIFFPLTGLMRKSSL